MNKFLQNSLLIFVFVVNCIFVFSCSKTIDTFESIETTKEIELNLDKIEETTSKVDDNINQAIQNEEIDDSDIILSDEPQDENDILFSEFEVENVINSDENSTNDEVNIQTEKNYTYTNISEEKFRATTVVEKEKNVIDLESWKYGMTPIEWIYVSPNKQLISNTSPNKSAKFGYKQNASSGGKGCYVPVFTKCETYGDDYEGRVFVYEDYTKTPIDEIKFANKFDDLMYGDYNVKDLLSKKYEITKISDGVVMAGDAFVNIVYVSELDDIISDE